MFKIGFNRAARIMDQLAEAGVVGEEEGTKPRKVLMSMEQFEQYIEESVKKRRRKKGGYNYENRHSDRTGGRDAPYSRGCSKGWN